MENGSGGFLTNLTFVGGNFGYVEGTYFAGLHHFTDDGSGHISVTNSLLHRSFHL
jgi:hypothetical protein